MLSFWLAYILTRPLGANLGDWLALPKAEGGLGLGTAVTSVIFLLAILATVIYLTVTRKDVIELEEAHETRPPKVRDPRRERIMLGYFAAVAIGAGCVLAYANAQPHSVAAASEEGPPATGGPTLTPAQATQNFPTDKLAVLRMITQATLSKLQEGNQAGATANVDQLETTWDADQPTLEPLDKTAWTFLDGRIDTVLQALRAKAPDNAAEVAALQALAQSLG